MRTTVVYVNYNPGMESLRKPAVRGKAATVRQSVTMPVVLAREVKARAKLTGAYQQFMAEGDPAKRSEAGEDLIRSIFGSAAIAVDPLR